MDSGRERLGPNVEAPSFVKIALFVVLGNCQNLTSRSLSNGYVAYNKSWDGGVWSLKMEIGYTGMVSFGERRTVEGRPDGSDKLSKAENDLVLSECSSYLRGWEPTPGYPRPYPKEHPPLKNCRLCDSRDFVRNQNRVVRIQRINWG